MTSRRRHRRIPSSGSAATNQTTASTASTTVQAPNPSRMGSSQPSSSLPSVRRTLFTSGGTRSSRRQATTTTSTATPDSNSSLPSDLAANLNGSSNPFNGGRSKSASKQGTYLSSTAYINGDIVARDKNGCYKFDIPVLPPSIFDDEAEDGDPMEGIEHSGGAEIPVEDGGGESAGRDQQSIEASFVDMLRHDRCRHANGEPSGFLTIQQNLREKVLGLDEDKWMFEAGETVNL